MTDKCEQQNSDLLADAHELTLLAKIEGLKEEIVKNLTLLAAHPDTPEFFKNHPAIQELVK